MEELVANETYRIIAEGRAWLVIHAAAEVTSTTRKVLLYQHLFLEGTRTLPATVSAWVAGEALRVLKLEGLLA